MIDRETLRRAPLFADLRDEATRHLLARAVVRSWPARRTLWQAGEAPRGLFVLLEGEVRILRVRAGRQSVVHTVAEPGATLGEVPLFAGAGYPGTAEAVARTRCLVVDAATLRAALAADPRLAERLLAGLGRRVRELVERIESLTVDTVRTRLAARLLALADDAPGAIARYRSQHGLAEELGSVREVVARELGWLRRRGLVAAAGRGAVAVLDREGLAALAGSSA